MWTYSGNPATSDRDALRFLIQDTTYEDQQLSDEELDHLLAQRGSVLGAGIAAINRLIARYTRQANRSMGQTSIQLGDVAAHYRALLRDIQTEAALYAAPLAPGLDPAFKDTQYEDEGLVQPGFRRDVEFYEETTE